MKLIINLLMVAAVCSAIAQNPNFKVNSGPSTSVTLTSFSTAPMAANSSSVYVMLTEGTKAVTREYPVNSLTEKSSISYKQSVMGEQMQGLYSVGEHVLGMFTEYDKKIKAYECRLKKINGAEFMETPGVVMSAPLIKITQAREFTATSSPNYKKLLVLSDAAYGAPFLRKKGDALFELVIIDEDLKMTTRQVNTLESERLTYLSSYGIEDDGTVNLLVTIYNDKVKEVKDGEVNFELHLYIVDPSGALTDIALPHKNYYYKDWSLVGMGDGRLALAGAYIDDVTAYKNKDIKGTFCVVIDTKAGKVISEYSSAWSSDLIADLHAKEKSDSKGVLQNYSFLGAYPTPDDGMFYVFEYYMYTEKMVNGAIQPQTTCNDIIVAYSDASGKQKWVTMIPKSQRTGDWQPNTFSIVPFTHNNALYVIYNDNIQNFERTTGNPIVYKDASGMATNIVLARVDGATGTVSYSKLNNDTNHAALIWSVSSIGSDQILIPAIGTRHKDFKLYAIKLN